MVDKDREFQKRTLRLEAEDPRNDGWAQAGYRQQLAELNTLEQLEALYK